MFFFVDKFKKFTSFQKCNKSMIWRKCRAQGKEGKLKKWKAITFSRNEVYFPPTLKEVEKRINGGE